MLFLLNKKKMITPADLPFGHGDGVYESALRCGAAAFLSHKKLLKKRRSSVIIKT